MDTLKRTMAGLAFAVGIVALASPSSAQTAPSSRNSEAEAVHDCSARASKFPNDTNETNQIITYHACMGQHGHQE
jgi:hypothetical protein